MPDHAQIQEEIAYEAGDEGGPCSAEFEETSEACGAGVQDADEAVENVDVETSSRDKQDEMCDEGPTREAETGGVWEECDTEVEGGEDSALVADGETWEECETEETWEDWHRREEGEAESAAEGREEGCEASPKAMEVVEVVESAEKGGDGSVAEEGGVASRVFFAPVVETQVVEKGRRDSGGEGASQEVVESVGVTHESSHAPQLLWHPRVASPAANAETRGCRSNSPQLLWHPRVSASAPGREMGQAVDEQLRSLSDDGKAEAHSISPPEQGEKSMDQRERESTDAAGCANADADLANAMDAVDPTDEGQRGAEVNESVEGEGADANPSRSEHIDTANEGQRGAEVRDYVEVEDASSNSTDLEHMVTADEGLEGHESVGVEGANAIYSDFEHIEPTDEGQMGMEAHGSVEVGDINPADAETKYVEACTPRERVGVREALAVSEGKRTADTEVLSYGRLDDGIDVEYEIDSSGCDSTALEEGDLYEDEFGRILQVIKGELVVMQDAGGGG